MRIALAWTSGQQIEIVHTAADAIPLYDDWIDEAWPFVIRQLAASGRPLVADADTDMPKTIYAEALERGHDLG